MPAKKNAAATPATTAQAPRKHRGKYMPLEQAKPLFLGLLEKHGRLSRTAARPLMAKLGFSERANWIALPQQLIDEGLIRKEMPNREEGEKAPQYTLTAKGTALVGGKAKPTKKAGKAKVNKAAAATA
jgi:hypothetical protein